MDGFTLKQIWPLSAFFAYSKRKMKYCNKGSQGLTFFPMNNGADVINAFIKYATVNLPLNHTPQIAACGKIPHIHLSKRLAGELATLFQAATGSTMHVSLDGCWNYLYTSGGHDDLDAERGSGRMSTHWSTVWSNRHQRALSLFSSTAFCTSSSSTANSTFFHVWGSNPSQGNILWYVSNDNSYQSIGEVVQKIFSIDWPLQKVGRRKKKRKNCLDWDSNPRPGNVESAVELELSQHAVEGKRESA